MNTKAASWLDRAIGNPAAIFRRPADVLASADLSRADKIRVLRAWEYDVAEQEVAEEEGMRGNNGDQLQDILCALVELDCRPAGAVAPSKQHGFI